MLSDGTQLNSTLRFASTLEGKNEKIISSSSHSKKFFFFSFFRHQTNNQSHLRSHACASAPQLLLLNILSMKKIFLYFYYIYKLIVLVKYSMHDVWYAAMCGYRQTRVHCAYTETTSGRYFHSVDLEINLILLSIT